MTTVTINATQRLFVIPCAGGFSCLGFDVVAKRLREYAKKLGWAEPSADVGTLEQYEAFRKAEAAYIATRPTETQFDPDTPLKVQALLEAYRQSNRKVRLFFGDKDTGRDWMSEYDVLGYVSRSMGPLKTPILLSSHRSSGGPAILTACVVRIVDATTKQELYRHRDYAAPALSLRASSMEKYSHEVLRDGEVVARFKSERSAARWMAFMQGTSMQK